jgi:hypothetical protein
MNAQDSAHGQGMPVRQVAHLQHHCYHISLARHIADYIYVTSTRLLHWGGVLRLQTPVDVC